MAKAFWNRLLQSDQTLVPDPSIGIVDTDSNLPDPGLAPLINGGPGIISSPGPSLQAAAGGPITAPDQPSLSATAFDSVSSSTWTVDAPGGLVFNNTFTSNVTDAAGGAGYKAAIDAAETYLSAQFTNSVTVNVTFDLAVLLGKGAENTAHNAPVVTYSDLLNALQSHATSADDLAAVAALGNLSDPSNGAKFVVAPGLARILGLITDSSGNPVYVPSDTTTPDDTVTLNSFFWNALTFGPFASDAQAAIEHELSEGIMGRLGSLGKDSDFNGHWAPMDLFRFTSAGTRDFTGSSNTATYFSPDGNNVNTGLQYNSLDSSGNYNGDLADWIQTGDDANGHDPFGPGGPFTLSPGTLSTTDMRILDVLGWTRADLPDLIVSSITPATMSVPQGTDLSFSYVIKNQAAARLDTVAGQSVEAWQVDAPPTATNSLGSNTLNSLGGGLSAEQLGSISTAGLRFGTHTLWVAADNTNLVNESDETNNVTMITFTVTGPDLIVSSITPTSTSVPRGTTLDFRYVIKNQGTLPAGQSVEAWQVDARPTPASSLGSDTLSSLDSGASHLFGGSISTLHLSVGPHTLWIGADNTNLVSEDNETNNLMSITFTVAPPLPPTLVADRAGVKVGASVTADAAHGVLANDTDPVLGDTLQVSAVDGQVVKVGSATNVQGTFGSLTLSSDGSYSYVASSNAALPASGVGQDVFTYTALTGAGGTADSTLTVIVTATGLNYLGGTPGVTITAPGGHSPVLDGGAGNDTLVATHGATVVIGGPGDTLTGGKGADTYVFLGHFGQNTITNYNPNKDIIELDKTEFGNLGAVKLAAIQQAGTHNTVIADTVGDAVTLIGVTPSQLHIDASHFLLA